MSTGRVDSPPTTGGGGDGGTKLWVDAEHGSSVAVTTDNLEPANGTSPCCGRKWRQGT